MKSKSLILMIVSLGFGLIAAVGISQVMGRGGSDQPELKTGSVVVPIDDLEHNSLLSAENCKIVDWPIRLIPEGSATSLTDIEDMATNSRLLKDMPVLMSGIVHKTQRGKLPIPAGQKVVSIKVTSADAIDGLLQPGDRVDVVGIFKLRREEKDLKIAKTFLKNITVFAVAGRTQNDGTREPGTAKNSPIVSVLVSPQQAEMLILVQKEAQLTLTLRGEEDNDSPEGVADEDFLAKIFNGFGEEEEEKPKEKGGSMTDYLSGIMTPKAEEVKEMRIWMGSEPVTYTFGANNELPKSDRFPKPQDAPPATVNPAGQTENTGNDDYNRPAGNDRNLEEDQYPGE